jgi:hypothetical protein
LASEELLSVRHLLGDKYHPLQPALLNAKEFEVACVGGMGAGKTYAACVLAIRQAAKFPGARVLIARSTYDRMVNSTKYTFFELVRSKGLQKYFDKPAKWDYREGTNYARMVNGSEFHFSNLDINLDKFKNVEYSLVIIDQAEEIGFEVYQLLLIRCRFTAVPPDERHVIAIANDAGDNWVRRRFLTFERPHGLPSAKATRRLIKGVSYDNPHLDEGAKAQLQALPPEIQQRWVYATMDAGASRLLPDFRLIEPVEIPPHWPRWVGIDPARSTGITAALWVAVNPDKEALGDILPNAPHFYNEYWVEGRDAELHADAIIEKSFPYRIQGHVMDRTAFQSGIKSAKFGQISVADLYIKAGLPVAPSSGDEWTRVMLFIEAHKRGLTVSKQCEHLIHQGPDYRLRGQEMRTGDGASMKITAKAKFHAVDAGGYALSIIPTRVAPVDLRGPQPFFPVVTEDEYSVRHWQKVLSTLPRVSSRGESTVTLGFDEKEYVMDLETDHTPEEFAGSEEAWDTW